MSQPRLRDVKRADEGQLWKQRRGRVKLIGKLKEALKSELDFSPRDEILHTERKVNPLGV